MIILLIKNLQARTRSNIALSARTRIFMDKVYLILENGDKFEGYGVGASGEVIGEVVFTTSMGGYLETVADPTYAGQIVVQTFPLIGNYGDIPEDYDEKSISLAGYVCREICDDPSNFRCKGKFADMLERNGVVTIAGVDTRRLTKAIRENGVMNGIITKNADIDAATMKKVREYRIKDAVAKTSCKSVETFGDGDKNIAVVDYGESANLVNEFVKRGFKVTRFPHDSKAEEVLECKPSGIVLSNGAGDPSECKAEAVEADKLLKSGIPMLAVSLGHQILALSQGGKTYKLKYGHRGGNQPVKETFGERIFITSQNHGYAVDNNAIPDGAKLLYVNANDGTCEGLVYKNAVSVQFHPEECGGPLDTQFIIENFIAKTEEK